VNDIHDAVESALAAVEDTVLLLRFEMALDVAINDGDISDENRWDLMLLRAQVEVELDRRFGFR
jgi:hypothetical protein